ncbi:MAG: response regulator, partial [Desulfohalobiaceae bacterium]|nr:response regulator [Desulfohalobiaceae bacterium]
MNQKTTILLIENDPGDIELLQKILSESENGSIIWKTAHRLSDGIELLAHHCPDLIIVDLGLPDSQGLQTLTKLLAESGEIPIIVMTSNTDKELGLEAVKNGAQEYLVKGESSPEEISRSLRYAIERKHLENELREAKAELEHRVKERTAELEKTNETLRKSQA